MGIYSGWIVGLSMERGISGFFRGLIVSAGGFILGAFIATFVLMPFENRLTGVMDIITILVRVLLRMAFLFYPAYAVARRKNLPLAWAWGIVAFGYGFPNNLNSTLIVGIAGAMRTRALPEETSEDG